MKTYRLILAAAALAAMAACSKTEVQKDNSKVFSFQATMEETPAPGSKATIGTNTNGKPQTYWEDRDQITVYTSADKADGVLKTAGYTFSTALSDNSLSATFSYSGSDFTEGNCMAIYPASSAVRDVNFTGDGNTYRMAQVTVPASQTLVAGSFDRSAAIASAFAAEGSTALEFKNNVALLKFRVSNNDNHVGRIESGYGDLIAGVCRVDIDQSTLEPTLTARTCVTHVDFSTGDTTPLSVGTDYYVAVRPAALTDDLKIYFDGHLVKTVSKASVPESTLKRNTVYNLGTLAKDGDSPLELVFDFTETTLDGWPTAATAETMTGLECSYPLYGNNYSFILQDVGGASTGAIRWVGDNRLILNAKRYLGLPAIEGYKLTKVSAYSYTSANMVNIVKSVRTTSADDYTDLESEIVAGGKTGVAMVKDAYNDFDLTETASNTRYYIHMVKSNGAFHRIILTYTKATE
ncbi:MAG: hypothetical protein IJQ93_11465 [Bacteroidales bacterium]|nr:hypothetical protein [Bacteroidales bacterium]